MLQLTATVSAVPLRFIPGRVTAAAAIATLGGVQAPRILAAGAGSKFQRRPIHTSHPSFISSINDFDVFSGGPRPRANIERFTDKGFFVSSTTPGAPEPSPPVFLRGPILLIDGQAVLWDVNTQVPDPATAPAEAAISQCLATWDEDALRVFELMKNKPEIVVFGTGNTLLPLPQRLRQVFTSNGMQVEVASTRNACSTFNVLVAEGRHVAACLLPLAPSSPLKEEPKPSKAKKAADAIAGMV